MVRECLGNAANAEFDRFAIFWFESNENKGILDCSFSAPVSRIFMVDVPCRLPPLLAIPW